MYWFFGSVVVLVEVSRAIDARDDLGPLAWAGPVLVVAIIGAVGILHPDIH